MPHSASSLVALRDDLLHDVARDTRVHNWIASQYSFALDEAMDTGAALRDSQLLPDVLIPLSPSYDPLFFPDPDPPKRSQQDAAREDAERNDALEFLVSQMATWRVAPANREKALPATPPSSPSTPTLDDFPSPPTTTPSSPSVATFALPASPSYTLTPVASPVSPSFPVTPSPARRRPSVPVLSTSPSTSFSTASPSTPTTPTTFFPEPTDRNLTSSASYASLRQRAHQHRFPSISTTLSTTSAVARHAIYIPPPSPVAPSVPTPTPPPPHGLSEVHLPDAGRLAVYPSGGFGAEASRWSVATSAHMRPIAEARTPTPSTPNPVDPVFDVPTIKAKKSGPSIRQRLLSTLGIKSSAKTASKRVSQQSAPPADALEEPVDVVNTELGFLNASTPHLAVFPPTIEYPATTRRVSWSPRRRATSGTSHIKEKTGRPSKRLVVTGVRDGDLRAEEAVRLWCESFGALRRIVRKDGALHISFKKASVADTVCRLQAQVFIRGAGSVGLSWTAEPKMF
ncbi:hypothetical protein FA95DRAFT_1607864 [Auriscalpium vulgare]|uniref:Uncharacterized protein n=1 Tax=Auriscalpium vulgare TaxID=40419 RepID=A0ACB8RN22_9AGAM|nr:hypothetical protein FA95DRAFT_1607864 [Auriscalpium vulgare]